MDTNVKLDVGNNATALIEKLAHQLGVAADKVFPWYVKQQVIEGYVSLGFGLFVALCAITLLVLCWNKADFKSGNRQAVGTGAALIAIIMLLIIAFSGGLSSVITQIANPQYAATHQILRDISALR